MLPATRNEVPATHEMTVYHAMAEDAANSKLYKNIGDKAAIVMNMLAARELGIPPVLALNGGIRNINGNIEISARMMNALMRRAGIRIAIKESTDNICVLTGTRPDGDTATVSYSLKEAQGAGLVKQGGGWTKNPKDMCFARAISRLARQLAPDVIGGCYVEGEVSQKDPDPTERGECYIEKEIPEDCVTIEVQDPPKLDDIFLALPGEDQNTVQVYVNIVATHFGWSTEQTIAALLKDKSNLKAKYETWKSKTKQQP